MAAHRAPGGPRAAPPTIVGTILLVGGALALFATVVGYAWAPAELGFWDRLGEGDSFGLPSSVTGVAGTVAIVIGLLLLGIGLGTLRDRRSRDHHPHPI